MRPEPGKSVTLRGEVFAWSRVLRLRKLKEGARVTEMIEVYRDASGGGGDYLRPGLVVGNVGADVTPFNQ